MTNEEIRELLKKELSPTYEFINSDWTELLEQYLDKRYPTAMIHVVPDPKYIFYIYYDIYAVGEQEIRDAVNSFGKKYLSVPLECGPISYQD